MNTRTFPVLAAGLALLGLAARPAAAQNVYYTSDATINTAISNGFVGYASDTDRTHLTSPTVSLVSGGLVKEQTAGGNLYVYNHSVLNMSGGEVNYEVIGTDTSTVNVSGGTIGSAHGALYAEGGSTASVSGGSINFVSGYDISTVTISGGTFAQNNVHGATFYDDTTGAFTFVGTGLSAAPLGYDAYFQGDKYLLAGVLQGGEDITGRIIAVAGGATMFAIVPAPEPSALLGLAFGAMGVGGLALRRRSQKDELA